VDDGRTWNGPLTWSSKSATAGLVIANQEFDNQKIVFGVGENDVGTCTDQGLYLWNGLTGKLGLTVNSVSGAGLGLTIAVGPAIANGNRNIVSTMWDRGPTASWDGGKTWPANAWYGCQWWTAPGGLGAPANVGEGGVARTFGNGGMHMLIYTTANPSRYWTSAQAGTDFTPPQGLTFPGSGIIDGGYDPFDWERKPGSPGEATGRAYMVVGGAILRSDDFGVTWANTLPFSKPPVAPVRSVSVDPTNGAVWAVGPNCVSRWAPGSSTSSWGACKTAGGSSPDYMHLAINPTNSSNMLLVVNKGTVMRTFNGGDSWSGVTDSAVNKATALAYHPMAAYSFSGKTVALVAAVTVPGQTAPHVFKSKDDGMSWTEEANSDLRTLQINSMSWNGGDLILGTSGQGIVKGAGFDG
jgi:hypothetical protein